jgi:hypothetical protein
MVSKIPASIRYNNPGAMWGGNALTRKWGETGHIGLNDGLKQGNQIAIFPDKIHGACAQFDLWRTSKYYHDKTLKAAITTWSGGNWVDEYVSFIEKHAPGINANTVISSALLSSPLGIAFVKAQAWHEAGQSYPMTDAEWSQAQSIVFGGVPVELADDPQPLILIGASGNAVSKIQHYLGVKETGVYLDNSETKFALQLFQVRNGLTPDGKCGQLTWAKLEPKTT